ncbi:MAG: hypothetical protein ACRCZO_01805 [Cetobacterium sp.]
MKNFTLNIFTSLITNFVSSILGAVILFIYASKNDYKIKLKTLYLKYIKNE